MLYWWLVNSKESLPYPQNSEEEKNIFFQLNCQRFAFPNGLFLKDVYILETGLQSQLWIFSTAHPLLFLSVSSLLAPWLVCTLEGPRKHILWYFINFLGNLLWIKKKKNLSSGLKELTKFPKVPPLFKKSLHFNSVHVNLRSSPSRW